MVDDIEEVLADHWFTAPEVHVEHLQVSEFINHGECFGGGEFFGVAAPRRTQAVHTRQVAGVGEFPREADGGIEATLELLNKRRDRLCLCAC